MVTQKLKTKNNLITKFTGTSWGAGAETLRTAALSLVYSTAEYCAPVWIHSAHAKKIDRYPANYNYAHNKWDT